MKLIVTSDWHGDWHTDGYERCDDLLDALDSIIDLMRKRQSVFMFLGDLTNPYSRNLHVALKSAVRVACVANVLGAPNYWIVGNHDVIEDVRGSHSLMAVEGTIAESHTTRVFSQPACFKLPPMCGDTYCVVLPYTSPRFAYDPEEVIRNARAEIPADARVVIAGHLNIEGVEPGSETADMPRGRSVLWPTDTIDELFPNALLLNGHYHRQQLFNRIHIPGSLLRLTHSEEENVPGFLVFDL